MNHPPLGEPSDRDGVVHALAALMVRTHPLRVLRVAIDGPDAAGKTTLADDLAAHLTGRGRPVIRASVDDFHASCDGSRRAPADHAADISRYRC